MTQLQKIVAKAKTLKKSHPNTKWTDLIKKASKLVSPAKKSVGSVKKKSTVKKAVKKYAPVKPLAKKKKAVKKSIARSTHKDTKSHNVNIRVMSGINDSLKRFNDTIKEIHSLEEGIIRVKKGIPDMHKFEKQRANEVLRNWRKMLIELKAHARELKKHIK